MSLIRSNGNYQEAEAGCGFYVHAGNLTDLLVYTENFKADTYRFLANPTTGGLVIDIGANIGAFSVIAGRENDVLAFEPQIENYNLLLKNIAESGTSVRPFNLAVGLPGVVKINNQAGCSRADVNGDPCFSIALDDIFTFIGDAEVDFLKMDIEGGEYEAVLNSNPENLKKVKRIGIELHSDLVAEAIHQGLLSLLEENFDFDYSGFNKELSRGVLRGVRKETNG